MTTTPRPTTAPQGDIELLERLSAARQTLLEQVGHRIVGQHEVVDGILTAFLAGGHALLIGVPGLAKTLLVSDGRRGAGAHVQSRIQFTPDLMPCDITGTEIIEEDAATGKRGVPVRARAGVRQHRAGRRDQPHAAQDPGRAAAGDAGAPGDGGGPDATPCPTPFFVLATQNPIEQEGTYPLPEAQLDRFMFELRVGYPSRDEEEAIVVATTARPRGGDPAGARRPRRAGACSTWCGAFRRPAAW